MIATLQEILTSHIFELELPCLHNLIVHITPHVTNLPSRQGLTRHTCIIESYKDVLVMINLKDKKHTTQVEEVRVCVLVLPRKCLWLYGSGCQVLRLWNDGDSIWSDSNVGAFPSNLGPVFIKTAAHVSPQVGSIFPALWARGRRWHTWGGVNQRSSNSSKKSSKLGSTLTSHIFTRLLGEVDDASCILKAHWSALQVG